MSLIEELIELEESLEGVFAIDLDEMPDGETLPSLIEDLRAINQKELGKADSNADI